MASLTIRNIEESIKASLRVRAAEHGRSMEEEARQILRDAQIAAIARTGELALATRNVKDFAGIDDLNIVDPWRS